MFNLFSKPDPKDQQREADKVLRKAGRDIERNRKELEREENKLELEIKRLAKEGNNDGCKLLAKQLIQLRKQKNRLYNANSQIQGIGARAVTMRANAKLADAMGTTAKTMGAMNKITNPEKLMGDMEAFKKQSMKMDMTEELINDTLDDMLEESGDEEESDNIITQVLDEIGIEVSGKMRNAPDIPGKIGEGSKISDRDIEKELAKLKAL